MKYNLEIHLERQHKEEERNALPEQVFYEASTLGRN